MDEGSSCAEFAVLDNHARTPFQHWYSSLMKSQTPADLPAMGLVANLPLEPPCRSQGLPLSPKQPFWGRVEPACRGSDKPHSDWLPNRATIRLFRADSPIPSKVVALVVDFDDVNHQMY